MGGVDSQTAVARSQGVTAMIVSAIAAARAAPTRRPSAAGERPHPFREGALMQLLRSRLRHDKA